MISMKAKDWFQEIFYFLARLTITKMLGLAQAKIDPGSRGLPYWEEATAWKQTRNGGSFGKSIIGRRALGVTYGRSCP